MTGKELKRGTIEMVLLRLLSQRPMYGYELVSTLEQRGGDQFVIKEGTLYPVLYRLEKAGWVESYWETDSPGVPRKYYHLTAGGERQLATLVTEWRQFVAAINKLLGDE